MINKAARFLIFFLVFTCAFAGHSGPVRAQLEKTDERTVVAPFDTEEIRMAKGTADTESFTCLRPPSPVKNLHFQSVYTDRSHGVSIVDPKAQAEYRKASEPLKQYEQAVIGMTNRYVQSKPARTDIAACALKWMKKWAKGNALLGSVNPQGEAVRKWSLGSLANAYIQIRDAEGLRTSDKKRVEKWLTKVAWAVARDYSRHPESRSRRNNHLYWAAWGVASAAIATDHPDLFGWAMRRAKDGIHQIAANGTLPLEMDRQYKALHYHAFALLPLIMLAEAGTYNGYDLYEEKEGRLHILVKRVLKGLKSPSWFRRRTGKKQDLTGTITSGQLAWLEPYHRRFPSSRTRNWLKKMRPMKQRRMGGDLTLLYSKPSVPPRKDVP